MTITISTRHDIIFDANVMVLGDLRTELGLDYVRELRFGYIPGIYFKALGMGGPTLEVPDEC